MKELWLLPHTEQTNDNRMEKTYSLRKFSDDATVKRPKELTSFSRQIDNTITLDDSQLSYYYFADGDLNTPDGVDLSGGFSNFKVNDKLDFGDLAGMLSSIVKYEREHQKKISAKLVSFRGLLKKLMMLPYDGRDSLAFNIVVFDGQLFMQQDIDHFKFTNTPYESLNDINRKFTYSGYKFETIATLPKPWAQCSRKEIEKRNKLEVNNIEQYCTVVKTTIGSTSLLLGAEVDCAWDYKPTDGSDALSHYVELKTTGVLNDPTKVKNFETKLLSTWAQCFLVGIPRIVYAFRDGQLKIRSVEEFKTEEIPLLLKNNPLSVQKHQQNPNLKIVNKSMQSIKFLSGILSWLQESISLEDESKTYKLQFDPKKNSMFVSLSENLPEESAKLLSSYVPEGEGGMLTDEFKEWRQEFKELKSKA